MSEAGFLILISGTVAVLVGSNQAIAVAAVLFVRSVVLRIWLRQLVGLD
jgi:hypothetical protein